MASKGIHPFFIVTGVVGVLGTVLGVVNLMSGQASAAPPKPSLPKDSDRGFGVNNCTLTIVNEPLAIKWATNVGVSAASLADAKKTLMAPCGDALKLGSKDELVFLYKISYAMHAGLLSKGTITADFFFQEMAKALFNLSVNGIDISSLPGEGFEVSPAPSCSLSVQDESIALAYAKYLGATQPSVQAAYATSFGNCNVEDVPQTQGMRLFLYRYFHTLMSSFVTSGKVTKADANEKIKLGLEELASEGIDTAGLPGPIP